MRAVTLEVLTRVSTLDPHSGCACCSGWGDPWCRHTGHRRHGGGGQELHEDSLHRSKDLVSEAVQD